MGLASDHDPSTSTSYAADITGVCHRTSLPYWFHLEETSSTVLQPASIWTGSISVLLQKICFSIKGDIPSHFSSVACPVI
jgi:hypothetical protein